MAEVLFIFVAEGFLELSAWYMITVSLGAWMI
jgi:hypothetical protein